MAATRTAVAFGDSHSGFQCNSTLSAVYRLIAALNPHVVIHIGDLLDAYNLSKFSKDIYRLENLNDEMATANHILRNTKQSAPKAKRFLLEGNHELRLRAVINSTSNQIQELLKINFLRENLSWDRLLGLHTHDFEWVSDEDQQYGAIIPNLLIKHGNVVRKYSGYTARAEFEPSGVSGISGHTHRLGSYYHKTLHGQFSWHEIGCTCRIDKVDYLRFPNWQNGCAVITYDKNQSFTELVPIHNGRAFFLKNFYS